MSRKTRTLQGILQRYWSASFWWRSR